MMRRLLLTLLLLAVGTTVYAQNVINPRTLTFTASTDHDVLQSGQALVTRYDVQWFVPGATQPFQTDGLGKPTPDANRIVALDLSTVIMGLPIGNGYTTKAAAVGPGGQGVSAPSNPFDVAVRSPTAPTAVSLSR